MSANALFPEPDAPRVFSVAYRWEFIRRHPYYLRYWRRAQHACEQLAQLQFYIPGLVEDEELIVVLGAVGMHGPSYPDPSIPADKLVGNGAASCCAMPKTYKDEVSDLLRLPMETRRAIASVLTGSGHPPARWLTAVAADPQGDPGVACQVGDQFALCSLQGPGINEPIPDTVVFCPSAPLAGILQDVERLAKECKFGMPQKRRREDLYDELLVVWDRREGWTEGSYDGRKERRLKDIATELHLPLGTVQDRYRAAFHQIIRHKYDPLIWACLFGDVKLGISQRAAWRKSKEQRRQPGGAPVPATTLTGRWVPPDEDGQDAHDVLLEGEADRNRRTSEQDYAALLADLKELFKRGCTDEGIVAKINLGVDHATAMEAVRLLRERGLDGLL